MPITLRFYYGGKFRDEGAYANMLRSGGCTSHPPSDEDPIHRLLLLTDEKGNEVDYEFDELLVDTKLILKQQFQIKFSTDEHEVYVATVEKFQFGQTYLNKLQKLDPDMMDDWGPDE